MKRREFLKTGAMAVVGTAVATSGLIAKAERRRRSDTDILHPETS